MALRQFARISSRYSPITACMGRRGYADVPTQLSFTFATPAECFYQDAAVKQIDVPSLAGNFGILVQHVATLAVLKPGVVNVHNEDSTVSSYFVSSGSVTVNEDSSVQILAEEAVPLDRLDSHAIKEGLTRAQQEMTSAQSDVAKAEAQIQVECYEELQKAVA